MGAVGEPRISNQTLSMDVVHKPIHRCIPSALANAAEYKCLTETQRQNFTARLCYIEETCAKSEMWIKSREGFESHGHFIDEIELDLFSNLSIGSAEREVSPWLIHSSWTFDATPALMAAALPDCLKECSEKTQVGLDCEEVEFQKWLEMQIACLRSILDDFYRANDFNAAVGCLIGLDVCLCAVLTGVSKQRFNPMIKTGEQENV